uniref:Poly [ADP-ribose] polymerase n=1 Tax=Alexandrium catenella TaxID=2925 RepID=A0A7S1R3T9_ALECA
MVVVRLWKVVPGRLQREQQETAAELGPPTLLFHGTDAANVRPILANGFRLPKRSGMFGRGIYFAHCPLKSVQYAHRVAMQLWHYTVGFLLACTVYLGNTRKLRFAKDVKPSEDLKRGWLASIFGAKDYDSIHAPSGFFGSVRVSEYIVYQPHQAIPKYVLEFMEQPLDRQSNATN